MFNYNDFFTNPSAQALSEMSSPSHSALKIADATMTALEAGLGSLTRLPVDAKFSESICDPSFPRLHQRTVSTALIVAGGEGSRMRPLTDEMPKPLIQLNGKALADYTFDLMEAAGVTDFKVNTHYMAKHVADHIKARQGNVWNVRRGVYSAISQSQIGKWSNSSLQLAQTLLARDGFFYSNADDVFIPENPEDKPSNPYADLQTAWATTNADILLLLTPKSNAVGYEGSGDYDFDGEQVFWRSHETEKAEYVWAGTVMASAKSALRVLNAFRIAQKLKSETGTISSDKAHLAIGSLSDRDTGLLPKFGAVVTNIPYYDVKSPKMLERASRALNGFNLSGN
ncbi:MAG: sugar phosphate nucleotidyltransferase [Pseudomonadota bacterium]